jgi:hypothetical protein
VETHDSQSNSPDPNCDPVRYEAGVPTPVAQCTPWNYEFRHAYPNACHVTQAGLCNMLIPPSFGPPRADERVTFKRSQCTAVQNSLCGTFPISLLCSKGQHGSIMLASGI